MLHPLLNLILDGFEEKAIALYENLEMPSPLDNRWAGVAFLSRNQPQKAKDLLSKAVAQGCCMARIELAGAYRMLGDQQRADTIIEPLTLVTLSEPDASQIESCIDRVLLLRELAIHQNSRGDVTKSLATIEMAWTTTMKHSFLSRLQSSVAQVQAHIYLHQRQYAQAAYYNAVAIKSTQLPGRLARILINRSRCYLFQGDLLNAQNDLELVREKLEFIPSLTANTEYMVGRIYHAKQQWNEAILAFKLSSVVSRRDGDLDVAFHAELFLAACQSTLEQHDQAELPLTRAKKLKTLSERDQAFLEWRSGQVFCCSQPKVALVHLTKAKEAFDHLHMPREFMGVCLHMVNVYLQLEQPKMALSALHVAAHTAFESEDQAAWLELGGLPRVQAFLQREAPEAWKKVLMPDSLVSKEVVVCVQNIQLVTLGAAEVRVDGRVLHFDMTRTVEILAFLLQNPDSNREKILSALFADADPRKSGNYFHKARQNLKALTNAFAIEYDTNKKTYAVKIHANLYWDVQAIQHILSTTDDNRIISAINAYAGEFLPLASSEWAIGEREAMAWSIVKVGLETLQRWYDSGEHQKCLTLAHRLLEIEPFNTSIYEFMINTTLSLEGEMAAKRELLRASRRFVEHLGEVPIEFDRLRNALLN
jgi:two-component SAPR family response regulator